jgi:Nucleotidyltransferase of unknown function (DUF6036)
MSDLTTTLDLLVALLERMSVQYVIIGGLAVRAYAIPRATEDLDITLALDRGRLPEFYDALEKQQYAVPEPYRSGWVDQVKGLNLVKLKRYVGGHSIDVDLFLAESPYQEEILLRRCIADVEGRNFWIASPEDVVLLKLLAGRPRDLIDVNDVLFTQGELNVEYMRRWAGELGVEEALERALAEQTYD